MSDQAQGRRRLGWLWLLALPGVLGAGALYRVRTKAPLEVQVVSVARGEVREIVASAASGRVRPSHRVTVRAEIPGTVARIAKGRGERVDKDELIIEFLADELDARLAQANANLEAARVAVALAKTRQKSANRGFDRAKKLRQGGAISEAELERAEAEASASSHAVAQGAAAEKQAQAAVRLARVSKDRAIMRAPFSGVLQDVMVDPGVQVALGTQLFDLIDDSSVHVDVPVDESDVERIEVGQTVFLRTNLDRDGTLTGKVSFIPPAVGRSDDALSAGKVIVGPGDRSVYVEVQPEDPSRFRVGASVNAEFLVSAKADIVFVPSYAVMGRGVTREVFRLENGRARRVSFKPGLTSWERTEVVDGLEVGNQIISSLDVEGLEDGARVMSRDSRTTAERRQGRPLHSER